MSKETIIDEVSKFANRNLLTRALGRTKQNEFDIELTLFVTNIEEFNNTDWLKFLPKYTLVTSNFSRDDVTPIYLQLIFSDGIELGLNIKPIFSKKNFLNDLKNELILDKD